MFIFPDQNWRSQQEFDVDEVFLLAARSNLFFGVETVGAISRIVKVVLEN